MDAAGELAQLLQRAGRLVARSRAAASSSGPGRRRLAAQPQREGDQVLLGAVVQIAFDAAALMIGGQMPPS